MFFVVTRQKYFRNEIIGEEKDTMKKRIIDKVGGKTLNFSGTSAGGTDLRGTTLQVVLECREFI